MLITMRWTVVIPVKALPAAKSRLTPATADPAAHRRLVEAIRADTIDAVLAAPGVARVLLVADRPDGAPLRPLETLVQTRPGLNGAIRDAAEHAARHWPADGFAVLVGDLPALRPDELADALTVAAPAGGFVRDAAGPGTPMLATPPGHAPQPRFGAGSAAAHASGVAELAAGPGLRLDVDTADDLDAATTLGLGPATSAVRSPCLGMIAP